MCWQRILTCGFRSVANFALHFPRDLRIEVKRDSQTQHHVGKSQIGCNGLSRICGLYGIVTGFKPLAGWLATGIKPLQTVQGNYWLRTDFFGL